MVNPIDMFCAQIFEQRMSQKLGTRTCQKIKELISERYEMTISEAIGDFEKIDSILLEMFGEGAKKMEEDFVDNIIEITSKTRGKIAINDQSLCQSILLSYGNQNKKKIRDYLHLSDDIISNTLKRCNITKSSGYEIFSELIKSGLVYVSGYERTTDNKKVSKYMPLFDNVNIDLSNGVVGITVNVNSEFIKSSQISKLSS